jgi:hypothetical protein
MRPIDTIRFRTSSGMLRAWWTERGTRMLRILVVFLAALALLKLGDEFRRLVLEPGRNGAIDLRTRYDEVDRWFAGEPLYDLSKNALYPPATFVILWPLIGWLAFTPARSLWAVTTLAALAGLAYLIVRESRADTALERAFVALMLLAINATGVAVGNGQLILHILPLLLAGLFLVQRDHHGWGQDLMAAALLTAAMLKPNVSLPFLLLLLLYRDRLRPLLLVVLGYTALTLFAARFQEPSLFTLLYEWYGRASAEATTAGYANLQAWLALLGLQQWIVPALLITLMGLGLWLYRHRHVDLWLLLGVTAIVSRMWTYHRMYDDVLVLLPMIALFRIVKRGPSPDGDDVTAGVLLTLTLLAMLAPARLRSAPWPWYPLFTSVHAILWIAMLIFLLDRARREAAVEAV